METLRNLLRQQVARKMVVREVSKQEEHETIVDAGLGDPVEAPQHRPMRQLVPREPIALQLPAVPRPPQVGKSVCPKCQGAGFRRVNAAFGHPDFGKAIACECTEAERKKKRRNELAGRSDILGLHKFKDATFPSFSTNLAGVGDAYIASKRFADCPQGWLVMTGPKGCGKTHLAVAIAKERLSFGDTVLMQTVPDLLDTLRSAYKSDAGFEQALSLVQRVDLLVLDDYGAESSTPWAREKLFQMLNYRYNDSLPTVITSNCMSLADLGKVDTRIASRISDTATTTLIQIYADDYRPQNGQTDGD